MMVPIIAPPSAPYVVLREAGVRWGSPWYRKALVALWDAGLEAGVDPVVLAAQCSLETNWGAFGGAVTADFNNTCGLKIRNSTGDTPADHARFPADNGFPRLGALAHAHHLRLYCGLPVPADTPDPRAVWLAPGTKNFGTVDYVEDLGGKWAPDLVYGDRVGGIYGRILQGITGL